METTKPITAIKIEAVPDGLHLFLLGSDIFIGWEQCSESLAHASPEQRLMAILSPGGYGIHWPLIDEDLSVGGLVARCGH